MTRKSGIWRFSGVLRVVALVLATIYALASIVVLVAAYLAFTGDTQLLFLVIDQNSTAPLEPWQIILTVLIMFYHMGTFIFLCLAANQFLKASKRAGFFIGEVITACRKIAYGLMLYWFGLNLYENYIPGILTHNFPEDQQLIILWTPLDHYVILLVGVILLLMAQAIQEARDIDSDNKQFI